MLSGFNAAGHGAQIASCLNVQVATGDGFADQLGGLAVEVMAATADAMAFFHRGQADITASRDLHIAAAVEYPTQIQHVTTGIQAQAVGRFDTGGIIGKAGFPAAGAQSAFVTGDAALVEDVAGAGGQVYITPGQDAALAVVQAVFSQQAQAFTGLHQAAVLNSLRLGAEVICSA